MLNSDDLINKIKGYNKFVNLDRLNKAYNFAVKAHSNQKRDSGDPYSVHPIEVANILTELKLDSATIATGLLHDTIEDTFATYETIKGEFGEEVAELVEGVTKISEFENTAASNSKAENFRKLILATSKDIRVLLVKLADRLHNMRTIKSIKQEAKRKRVLKKMNEFDPDPKVTKRAMDEWRLEFHRENDGLMEELDEYMKKFRKYCRRRDKLYIFNHAKEIIDGHLGFGWTYNVYKDSHPHKVSIIQKRFRAYKEGSLTRKSLGIFTDKEKQNDWPELKHKLKREGFTDEQIEYFKNNHYFVKAGKKKSKRKKSKRKSKKKKSKRKYD